jgi:phosphotransferase system HPr (HPr) family protein
MEREVSEPCLEIEVEIRNPEGLHMRPAMQFVDLANTFDADISVSHGDTTVDGKSIMQMTMLAATCGSRLKIRAKGPEAQKAVEALKELAEQLFMGVSQPQVGQQEEG